MIEREREREVSWKVFEMSRETKSERHNKVRLPIRKKRERKQLRKSVRVQI